MLIIYFVILYCRKITFWNVFSTLPESVRWMVYRGRLEYVAGTIKRSHNITLEEDLKPKILAVYQEVGNT